MEILIAEILDYLRILFQHVLRNIETLNRRCGCGGDDDGLFVAIRSDEVLSEIVNTRAWIIAFVPSDSRNLLNKSECGHGREVKWQIFPELF
jgi:hypothetical protein